MLRLNIRHVTEVPLVKILVIEDDKNIGALCKYELEEEGYEVVVAGNGAKGLELFRKEDPDLVTLDIKLPDIDGIQLLRKMKDINARVPVIILTAFDYMYDFAGGASDAYIVKSSDLTELKTTIDNVLKGRQQAGPSPK